MPTDAYFILTQNTESEIQNAEKEKYLVVREQLVSNGYKDTESSMFITWLSFFLNCMTGELTGFKFCFSFELNIINIQYELIHYCPS